MFSVNKNYQDHNLKIGIKRISENGRKNSLQVCEPIILLLGSACFKFGAQTGHFYLTFGLLFLERDCDVTHGINTDGQRIQRNLLIAKIAYLTMYYM